MFRKKSTRHLVGPLFLKKMQEQEMSGQTVLPSITADFGITDGQVGIGSEGG